MSDAYDWSADDRAILEKAEESIQAGWYRHMAEMDQTDTQFLRIVARNERRFRFKVTVWLIGLGVVYTAATILQAFLPDGTSARDWVFLGLYDALAVVMVWAACRASRVRMRRATARVLRERAAYVARWKPM